MDHQPLFQSLCKLHYSNFQKNKQHLTLNHESKRRRDEFGYKLSNIRDKNCETCQFSANPVDITKAKTLLLTLYSCKFTLSLLLRVRQLHTKTMQHTCITHYFISIVFILVCHVTLLHGSQLSPSSAQHNNDAQRGQERLAIHLHSGTDHSLFCCLQMFLQNCCFESNYTIHGKRQYTPVQCLHYLSLEKQSGSQELTLYKTQLNNATTERLYLTNICMLYKINPQSVLQV